MKGKGIRSERETVIRFDEESSVANIWTASETIYRRLRKLGYCPTEDGQRSASFEVPKRDIKLPRPKSEMRSRLAKKRSEAARDTLFKPGTTNRPTVQPSIASKTYAREKKANGNPLGKG